MRKMQKGQILAVEVMNLPESITERYPLRPGLPGAPEPNARSIREWIIGVREVILSAAESTLKQAARIVWDDPEAASDLKDEARAFLSLATDLGDMCGME